MAKGSAVLSGVAVETGAEELRRIVKAIGYARESSLDGYSAEQLIALQRALWASGWDLFLDSLSADQAAAVLDAGEVPAFCESRAGLLCVPSSLADAGDVHDFLCHRWNGCDDPDCTTEADEERSRVYRAAVNLRKTSKKGGA